MAEVIDVVLVRFATKPYSFLRMAYYTLIPWLENRGIQYIRIKKHVYFELPDHMKRYTVITDQLCEELKPVARDFKHRLMALSFTAAKKVRQPLSKDEVRAIIEADLPLIL